MVTVTREDLTDFEKEFEEQASRYYNYNGPYDYWALRECCKELMVKAKEELMKATMAAEGLVILRDMYDNRSLDIDFVLPDNLKIGDKVKVIILKED